MSDKGGNETDKSQLVVHQDKLGQLRLADTEAIILVGSNSLNKTPSFYMIYFILKNILYNDRGLILSKIYSI